MLVSLKQIFYWLSFYSHGYSKVNTSEQNYPEFDVFLTHISLNRDEEVRLDTCEQERASKA